MICHLKHFVWTALFVGSTAFAQSTLSGEDAADAALVLKGPSVWGMTLSSENRSLAKDQNTLGQRAPVISLNSVGAVYKFSTTLSLELRQYFEYASNKENLAGRSALLHENAMEMSSTILDLLKKTDAGLLGANGPIVIEGRYYFPNDLASVRNKENGQFRADISTDWVLNPRWTVTGYVSPRSIFNSAQNPNAVRGSDAEYYRIVAGPMMSYNFTDAFRAYYFPVVDVRSVGAQRGNLTIDNGNYATHEVGLAWTVGPVILNPSITSDVDHGDASGSIFTDRSRVFAAETANYNLNAYATF